MAAQTSLLALSFAALLLIGGESATFTIKNNCPMTIWPAAFTGEGSQPSTTGHLPYRRVRTWRRSLQWSYGVPPATLVEFTLNDNGGLDTYDISNVDGSNLRVTLAPDNSACVTTSCLGDINADCPADLARKSGSETVGCLSDCAALNRPEDCCTGAFNTTQTCQPSRSANYFKEKCPQAYGYAFHDQTSTFTCSTGTNYRITFCP
ncbi:hypothetical protein DCAR_0626111 [Daucus carota subsp. sativus]|uniref:Thaumatin-like protein n=1 Tax=Daucus carota subsp. sativus TaxID=79200 RepID=A0A161ZYJ4_DAUCS|nr:hypothetical protein DCAR_0626111 [Daucus carota subsp. sativus]